MAILVVLKVESSFMTARFIVQQQTTDVLIDCSVVDSRSEEPDLVSNSMQFCLYSITAANAAFLCSSAF